MPCRGGRSLCSTSARGARSEIDDDLARLTEKVHQLAGQCPRSVHAGNLVLPAQLASCSHPFIERPRPGHDQAGKGRPTPSARWAR